MTQAVDLTVSVVSYHVADELRDCLASALTAAPRHQIEIIVVDNASGMPTQKVLDEYEQYERVRAIRNDDNRGFAAANNQALRQAKAKAKQEKRAHRKIDQITLFLASFVDLTWPRPHACLDRLVG